MTLSVQSVQALGVTVSDADRASQFFAEAFDFEPMSDVTVSGAAYDKLQGVFNSRIRIVTLQLGRETLRLMQYMSPPGRPIPLNSKSADSHQRRQSITANFGGQLPLTSAG